MGHVPSDGGAPLVDVSIALSVLQIVFVAARFYTRFVQRMRCGLDDYVILFALVGSLAKAIVYIVLVKVAGLGYHFDEITHPVSSLALIRKGFFVLEILDFPLTVTPAKISLLLFYVRIFYTRKVCIFAYLVGSVVLGLGIAVLFETIFQCSPIAYGWDSTIKHGKCIDQIIFYRAISPINVVTGVLILVMPMPLVWRLHAPKGQKLALTGVFLLGGLGTAASTLRMVIYWVNTKAELHDVTWFPVNLGILTVVEGAVLIIATCLVSIWPLFTRFAPRRLLEALSCYPQARQHQDWYMASRVPVNSEDSLTRGRGAQTRRGDVRNSSPSLTDLEDRRRWVPDEGGSAPRSCERIFIDDGRKYDR